MGHFQKMSLKLLGYFWIINMIHWYWQTLLLKELLFPSTLQLKCKKQIDQNCGKKGNLSLHIHSSCQSGYHYKSQKKIIISFQFSVFFSIILKKMLKICNIVNHSKVIITFFFKKSWFKFNFVNKVKMYVLPFEISDRKKMKKCFASRIMHTNTRK